MEIKLFLIKRFKNWADGDWNTNLTIDQLIDVLKEFGSEHTLELNELQDELDQERDNTSKEEDELRDELESANEKIEDLEKIIEKIEEVLK